MNISMLGIDLAKNVFQLHGIDASGKMVFKKRVNRHHLMEEIVQLPQCTIVIQACGAANYWYRRFSELGHKVKLISPQFVKPFVRGNKTDASDARAICEAASRPSMDFVSPKNIEQQDIQSLHRVRERLIKGRTALVNQIRGLLAEYGIIMAQGIGKVRCQLSDILEDAENELTTRTRALVADLQEELASLDKRVKSYDRQLEILAKESEVCQRLMQIEGISPLCATILLANVGHAQVFKNGRQMAAWAGLVPKQHSSGNKQLLLGISKRGDKYLRKMLIHGARSVVNRAVNKDDKRSTWINQLEQRRGKNKTCVAVANKNMRIAWSIITSKEDYRAAA